MPLFFLLSGMTTKLSLDADQFLNRTGKSFRRLIIPALITYFFICIGNLVRYGMDTGLKQYFADRINAMVYFSGDAVVSVNAPAVGAVWFLVALFFGRTFYDYLALRFNRNVLYAVCVIGACGGLCFAKIQWLPFSFDVVLVIMPFIMMGQLAREKLLTPDADSNNALINRIRSKNQPVILSVICIFLAVLWAVLFLFIYKSSGQYFELAIRRYPFPLLSYLCAFLGIAAACTASALIVHLKHISRALIYLGNQSMVVYLIHVVDGWWVSLWGTSPNVGVRIILRTVIDLCLTVIIIIVINKIKNYRRRKDAISHE